MSVYFQYLPLLFSFSQLITTHCEERPGIREPAKKVVVPALQRVWCLRYACVQHYFKPTSSIFDEEKWSPVSLLPFGDCSVVFRFFSFAEELVDEEKEKRQDDKPANRKKQGNLFRSFCHFPSGAGSAIVAAAAPTTITSTICTYLQSQCFIVPFSVYSILPILIYGLAYIFIPSSRRPFILRGADTSRRSKRNEFASSFTRCPPSAAMLERTETRPSHDAE